MEVSTQRTFSRLSRVVPEGDELTQKRKIIENWDLTQIKKRLVRYKGLSLDEVERLEIEYKRFLMLVIGSPIPLPVSQPVDQMWHEHVLFSRDYAQLAIAVEHSLFHNPIVEDIEKASLNDTYNNTMLPLYERTFGSRNDQYWPRNLAVCMCCDCGD